MTWIKETCLLSIEFEIDKLYEWIYYIILLTLQIYIYIIIDNMEFLSNLIIKNTSYEIYFY